MNNITEIGLCCTGDGFTSILIKYKDTSPTELKLTQTQTNKLFIALSRFIQLVNDAPDDE